jgi:putative ABC transport system substrate-binding protein
VLQWLAIELGGAMRRREFVTGLAGLALARPRAARSQEMPVIGYLSGLAEGDRPGLLESFHQGLAVTGYVAGRNVSFDYRYADSKMDRLPALVEELIARKVAVIAATGGNNPGLVAKSITSTVPIVFTSGLDPVRAGLVKSIGRPEANVTGVSFFTVELGQKHVELLREIAPSAKSVGLLLNRNNPEATTYEQTANEAVRALALSLLTLTASSQAEIDEAFGSFAREKVGGVILGADPYYTGRAQQIAALAARYAIPVIYSNREFTGAGGLISYGNNLADSYRRAGIYTGRILKGDRPADLPIDRATKFELVVNMKAARSLGIEIPLSLLMRIDEVIE